MEKTFSSRPPALCHSGVRMYQHWSSCRKGNIPLFLGPTFALGFPSRFSNSIFCLSNLQLTLWNDEGLKSTQPAAWMSEALAPVVMRISSDPKVASALPAV